MLKKNNSKTINSLLGATLAFNAENLICGTLYSNDTTRILPTDILPTGILPTGILPTGILPYNYKYILTLLPTSFTTLTTITNLIIYNNKHISDKNKKITLYTLTSLGLLPNIASLALDVVYLVLEPKIASINI
jgi:hypothetical protein